MQIFKIPPHSKTRVAGEGRLIFLSDAHLDTFGGIGGYSHTERHEIMIDKLIEEYNTDRSFDAVVFVGDTVTANLYLKEIVKETGRTTFTEEEETERVLLWVNTYAARLDDAGIPWYYVNASHEALYGDNFKNVFGYDRNYVLLSGTTAYIVCDTYGGPRNDTTYETTASDIPQEFYEECIRFLDDEHIEEAYIVSHYPKKKEYMNLLFGHAKVQGGIAGDSHFNYRTEFAGKPLMQTGHFSRGYTKMITHGLGFTPFAPLNDTVVGTTTDEEGRENHKDYSGTGSPWQWRVMETTDAGTESYIVFPEVFYHAFCSDRIDFPAFTQPYTEARPSFLGEDAPVDRSYMYFRK